ncbi:hypothetical protein ACQVP2_27405 [Methylobacterium aquaticum]|uniref:hypothetical protein n=1 Tax=Methylobacterium aquaticum TaxID=270351 RepID=UPI003D1848B3
MYSKEIEPFWMVFGVGCGAPTVRHKTENRAIAEASRLAVLNPGVKFCVLSSAFVIEKKDVSVKKLIDGVFVEVEDDIPF